MCCGCRSLKDWIKLRTTSEWYCGMARFNEQAILFWAWKYNFIDKLLYSIANSVIWNIECILNSIHPKALFAFLLTFHPNTSHYLWSVRVPKTLCHLDASRATLRPLGRSQGWMPFILSGIQVIGASTFERFLKRSMMRCAVEASFSTRPLLCLAFFPQGSILQLCFEHCF
jgi:hypothetical protein